MRPKGRSYPATGDAAPRSPTAADMQCGQAIGARAIGVATGRFSVEQLAEHGAVAVFENLADTDAVVAAVTSARD